LNFVLIVRSIRWFRFVAARGLSSSLSFFPNGCRAAEQRDEIAARHSITSSARASNSNLVWRFDRQIGCLRFPAF
jgi:hypothetical protein